MTGSLSNGGTGGNTGSSAGMTTSIPWCSGSEWNLGRCFGNQDGNWSAERETEEGDNHSGTSSLKVWSPFNQQKTESKQRREQRKAADTKVC